MTTLQIHLPDDLKARVAARAAESGFASVEAYVESLLQDDSGTGAVVDQEMEELLLRRLESGPGIELTPVFVEQFKAQVTQRRAAGGQRP